MVFGCRTIENETPHEAGRALLAQLYRDTFGGTLPPVAVTDRGKPYFPDNPVHFSITHTRRHAFVALSDRPIGIDAEELDRSVNPKLSHKILSPGEKAQYDAAPDKNRALLIFWVLKESQAKCTGEGLRGYPNHTEFSLDDPRVFEHSGCIVAIIEEEHHAF